MCSQFISRQKKGKGFTYYQAGKRVADQGTLERIVSLAIPPAWHDVTISSDPNAKVLARGRDSAGRLQAIYHPAFRELQDRQKYSRLVRFAQALPALRRQVNRDLHRLRSFGKDTVVAAALLLIDTTYFRVGNQRYASEHHVYGVTTLRSRHVDTGAYRVTFHFNAKSGKYRERTVSDRRLAHIIRQLDETPGQELFRYRDGSGSFHTITAADVNEYIKRYMGEAFTAKDFRTWGGTLTAIECLAAAPPAATPTARKKAITACVKQVARKLGNTPAVARSSYIDPWVLEHYLAGEDFSAFKHAKSGDPYLTDMEQGAIELLQTSAEPPATRPAASANRR